MEWDAVEIRVDSLANGCQEWADFTPLAIPKSALERQVFLNQMNIHCDDELSFRLALQRFKESPELGLIQSLNSVARTPEMVIEVKEALLAFATNPLRGQDQGKLEESSRVLHDLIVSKIRLSRGLTLNMFLLTLRYLVLVHNLYYFLKGRASPWSALTERLVLPSLECESIPGNEAVNEDDVALLSQSAGITRDVARNTLSRVTGSKEWTTLEIGMREQIARIQSDQDSLSQWVKEVLDWTRDLKFPLVPSTPDDVPDYIDQTLIPFILHIDPQFESKNPFLWFALRRVEIVFVMIKAKTLDSQKDWERATHILRCYLAPLSQQHSSFVSAVKELATLLVFKYSLKQDSAENMKQKALSLLAILSDIVQGPLYICLVKAMGKSLPKLLKCFNHLLLTYSKWFSMQGDPDRFCNVFEIKKYALDEASREFLLCSKLERVLSIPTVSVLPPPTSTSVSSELPEEGEASSESDSETFEETSVELVMDILACERDEAVDFLRDHGGNMQEVLSILYG